MIAPRLALCLGCLLAAFSLAACGGKRGPERVVVFGTVSYRGQPIPDGLIRFVPVEASSAPISGATIIGGRYRADSEGGVPIGTHKIEIEAHRPPKAVASGEGARFRRSSAFAGYQYIPDKYNVKTILEIIIQSGSREISKNFDLTD
jgi:hypothetical protein